MTVGNIINPLPSAQPLDRPLGCTLRYITILPSAFSAYGCAVTGRFHRGRVLQERFWGKKVRVRIYSLLIYTLQRIGRVA